jgi:hypothetical protein
VVSEVLARAAAAGVRRVFWLVVGEMVRWFGEIIMLMIKSGMHDVVSKIYRCHALCSVLCRIASSSNSPTEQCTLKAHCLDPHIVYSTEQRDILVSILSYYYFERLVGYVIGAGEGRIEFDVVMSMSFYG